MHKIKLVWRVAEKYEGTRRITEVVTPRRISLQDDVMGLLDFLRGIVVKKPKLPNSFIASFSRSLKSLRNRGLIEIYKTGSEIKVRITEEGRKVVKYLP